MNKPMRHEEYLAMAEQNRLLLAENDKLKHKNDKRPRPKCIAPRMVQLKSVFESFLSGLPRLLFAAIMIGTVFIFVMAMRYDYDKAHSVFDCASIDHDNGKSDQWDPYYIFKHSIGKHQGYWFDKGNKFDTYEEGQVFLKKWGIKECSATHND